MGYALILFLFSGLCFLGTWNIWVTIRSRKFEKPWVHLWSHSIAGLRGKHIHRRDENRFVASFWVLFTLGLYFGVCGLLVLSGYDKVAGGALIFLPLLGFSVVIGLLIIGVSAGLLAFGALAVMALLLLPLMIIFPSMRRGFARWRAAIEAWRDGKPKGRPKRKRKNDELV